MSTLAKNKENVVRSTKEGRLYIRTSDFFKQSKVQHTIHELLKSDIIRKIDENKTTKSK